MSETSIVKEKLFTKWKPRTIADWLVLLLLQVGWINTVLATNSIVEGMMTFPSGVLYLHVHALIIVVGLVAYWFDRLYALPFVFLSMLSIFSDWAFHPFGQNTNDEDVHIMTWNIQGVDTLTDSSNDCAYNFLKEWVNKHDGSILLFQEVPKSSVKKFEKTLSVRCTWTSYFNHSKVGLLLCADKDWRFRFENHRSLKTGSSYGFQQTEVSNPKTKQKFNLLNVHMPSLALVARQQGLSMRSDVIQTLKANPNLKHYFRLLKKQSLMHQESMDSILDLTSKLKDPTIIGGDFNMPPTAPIHDRLLNINMKDAHTEAGWGWDFTTQRLAVLFNRIDFLYASEKIDWVGQTMVHSNVECSDHKPVTAVFSTP